MSKLGLIIANEYRTDIKTKSFWIGTFLVPVIFMLFGLFIGLLAEDSESLLSMSETLSAQPDAKEMTGLQALGMMTGVLLVLFIMMYGSQIFNKVKVEKCNRIVEILATCVDGRTMMLAKIIAVGLIGLTQLVLWLLLIVIFIGGLLLALPVDVPWGKLVQPDVIMGCVWGISFFIGGYIFYGSLFAAVGAMTDKNNENQEYVAVLTFVLLASFYIGMFAVDNGTSSLAAVCGYIPFTAPSVACVNAVTQAVPLWQSLLSLLLLYAFAFLSLALSGKIYTSSLLLKGKRFTPRDIITFLKSR